MSPKALENRPPTHGWMKEYIKAFNTLSSTRQYGMGPNPITLTEILAYMKIWEVDDRSEFVHHVLAMDTAYLETKARKAEQEAQAKERAAKQKG